MKKEGIQNILESVKGSGRAKPSTQVWAKIEQQLFEKEGQSIPLSQWRIAAVAAVLLIALNVFSIGHYFQNTVGERTTENTPKPNQSIISNYQIYD